MGNSSNKPTTKGEPTPTMNKTTKPPLQNAKRELEDDDSDLENKVNLKKQKTEDNDIMERMQSLSDRLLRIEAIVDLLVSSKEEADHHKVLISPKDQNVPAKDSSSSEDDSSSSSDDDSDDESDEDDSESPTVTTKVASSSSSDDDSDVEDEDRLPVKKKPKADTKKKPDEDDTEGRFNRFFSGGSRSPNVGGRFAGGRCGLQRLCNRC